MGCPLNTLRQRHGIGRGYNTDLLIFHNHKMNDMENKMKTDGMKGMSYKHFSIMMVISFLIMYFVMFLNIDDISHYHTSTTRIYMALLMVSPMALVMMAMMGKMYPNRKTNMGIMVAALVVFIVT